MLRLEQVSRRFANGTVALEAVSLTIEAGEFVALLGPSGCGKSTLLRLMAGLDRPDSGRVERAREAGEVGFVFQDPTLLPWASALDNVRLPLRLRGEAGEEAAARTALARVGLEAFAGARPRELSGGMRMRVSLARSLVVRPALLLMDEPFAALDEFTRHALQDDLRNLWAAEGCSVVFVTHSIYEAAFLARRVVVLSPRPGRVAAEFVSPLALGAGRLDPATVAFVAELTQAVRGVHAA